VVGMRLGMLILRLRSPMEILQLPIRQFLLKQERLWRPITGFVRSSPSLGSCTARSIRRLYLQRSSCGEMLVRGGPTTPALTPRTTKCYGLSSVMPFTPITSVIPQFRKRQTEASIRVREMFKSHVRSTMR
jgi:hypothetical protein